MEYTVTDINVNYKKLEMRFASLFNTRSLEVSLSMAGKRRRTAEEAKAIILDIAAQRLGEFGLEGLNITGVAEAAGMSHATLIHHFGSSGQMREALARKMTLDLIGDLVRAIDARASKEDLARSVFSALADGGHATLLAWRSVEGSKDPQDISEVQEVFGKLLQSTHKVLDVESQDDLQRNILLIATAAIGYGIAGPVLSDVLGMSETAVDEFPAWVAQHLG